MAPVRFVVRRLLPFAAAIAVLAPLLRAPTSDTYPLSTYPMFARDRGAVHEIATAVAIGADDRVERLSPALIAGTDEVVLAGVTVRRAITRGQTAALCAEILERTGSDRRIVVRTELIDVVAHVVDGAAPTSITVHAECGRGS